MDECRRCRGYASQSAVALGLLCTLLSGCSTGIRWQGYTFERVHADSQRDQKLTFVYFRHWSVTDCTRFEEEVLKSPAVLQVTDELYCVPLDFYWDRPLAEEWGVEAPPGVVILDPGGRVLARLSGEISIEELLDAIQRAREEYAPAALPTRAP